MFTLGYTATYSTKSGAIVLTSGLVRCFTGWIPAMGVGMSYGRSQPHLREFWQMPQRIFNPPYIPFVIYDIPLWIPFLLSALAAAMLWWMDRRRVRPNDRKRVASAFSLTVLPAIAFGGSLLLGVSIASYFAYRNDRLGPQIGKDNWEIGVALTIIVAASYLVARLLAGWLLRRWPRDQTGWCSHCGFDRIDLGDAVCPRCGQPRTCPKCSYNLTGNVSGVCPECGHAVGSPVPALGEQEPPGRAGGYGTTHNR